MADTEKTVWKRSSLTGKDNYGTWSVSTKIAVKKLKAWKIINGEALVALDFYDDDPQVLSTACKEWLSRNERRRAM